MNNHIEDCEDQESQKNEEKDTNALITHYQGSIETEFNEDNDNLIDQESKDNDKISFPLSIYFIISNEFCERFSFYGMRAVLVLYMVTQLNYSKINAISLFAYSEALNYIMPIIGAILADNYIGKYYTILYLSLIYVLGSILLTMSALYLHQWSLFLGLIFIALGTGGIKPNVCAFGADQVSKETQISSFFHLFYFMINLGSISSIIIIPLIRSSYGFVYAFMLPALLLLISIMVFWLGRKQYRMPQVHGSIIIQFVKIIYCSLKNRNIPISNSYQSPLSISRGPKFVEKASPTYSLEQIQEVKDVLAIVPILYFLPMFWALFDQQGSSWTLQARQMNNKIFSIITIQPEQFQSLNPLLILILIPLMDRFVYPYIRRRFSSLTPLSRIAIGEVLIALSFMCSGCIDLLLYSGSKISLLWQIPQYILLSISEVLVSITSLEFAYSQAPHSMKSVCIAFYNLTISFGNLLVSLIYLLVDLIMPSYYISFIFSLLMIINFFIFFFHSRSYIYISPSSIHIPLKEMDNDLNNNSLNKEGIEMSS